MQAIFRAIREFTRKADMVLLLLCVTATIFGIVIISSATDYLGSARYVRIQTFSLILGIILYVLLTLLDVDIIAERRELLLVFCVLFIGMLRFFGVEGQTGNKSWLAFKFLPFNIQPAEICKVLYIIILAKTMAVKQNKLSSPLVVAQIAGITALLAGLIIVVSYDDGVALNYLLIFVIMAFVGGVNIIWFLAGAGALLVLSPIIWTRFFDTYQRQRILVLFDPTVDPSAQSVRWQMNRSLRMLQNGGVAGQGLGKGTMVQAAAARAAHRLHFRLCGRGAGDARLPCDPAAAGGDHRALRVCGRQIRQLYEPAHLRGHRGYAAVADRGQRGYVPGCVPGRGSDAAVLLLRRQLDRDDVCRDGLCLRHQYAPRARFQRALHSTSLLRQHRAIASARFDGSFSPILRFEKLEIHTVFLRFSNLDLAKNLSSNLLVELCGAALNQKFFRHGWSKTAMPEFFCIIARG